MIELDWKPVAAYQASGAATTSAIPTAARSGFQPDAQARPRRGQEQIGEDEAHGERERGGEQELGRQPELEAEEHSEPPRDAAAVDLTLEIADDRERDQRQQEDRRHVHVALLLAEHVAREAEQVAADERGPE